MTLGGYLRRARDYAGITQREVERRTGINYKSLSNWENDVSRPSPDDLKALASIYKVSIDYLVGETDFLDLLPGLCKKAAQKQHGIKIPVLGTIVAGIPVDAIEEILGWEEIPESMAQHGEYFALRVSGHSMEPKFIQGDTVIVRKESCVDSGRVAVVLVNGEDATLKQVNVSPDGITLIGYNTVVYEPHFYSNKEIQDLPVQILGEVVELRRKI